MKNYTKERRELKEAGWQRADRAHYDPATKTTVHVERWLPPSNYTGTEPLAVSYRTARRRFLARRAVRKLVAVMKRGVLTSAYFVDGNGAREDVPVRVLPGGGGEIDAPVACLPSIVFVDGDAESVAAGTAQTSATGNRFPLGREYQH